MVDVAIVNSDSLRKDFDNKLVRYGEPIRFRYFTPTIGGAGSYFDDSVTLARSGADIWTSGMNFTLLGTTSSNEPLLLEIGKVLQDDARLFVNGSIPTSGVWKVGLGSPVRTEYGLIEPGNQAWIVNGSIVFRELYIRVLTNGSLTGESP